MFISLVDEIFFSLGVEVKSIGSYDEVFFPFLGCGKLYGFVFGYDCRSLWLPHSQTALIRLIRGYDIFD